MIYIEMARDSDHGGGHWSFPNCVWSPTKTRDGRSWPYWEKVNQVRKGDVIIHLRGIPPDAYFTGYSIAASNGQVADGRPPNPGEWEYAANYYRAELENNVGFFDPINLVDVFSYRKKQLEEYLYKNRELKADKLNLFYVKQSGRLQCQNGAYLSDADDELLNVIFGMNDKVPTRISRKPVVSVETGIQIVQIKARQGQKRFADMIKSLYKYRCCFPGCSISDPRFLIGSHIARWSDEELLRGDSGNGLCLCLIHDKAFEEGMFTLDSQFRVAVHPAVRQENSDIAAELCHKNGQVIRLGTAPPSVAALERHWERIRFVP